MHALLLLLLPPSSAPSSTRVLSILRTTAAGYFRGWELMWAEPSGCAWESLFDQSRFAGHEVLRVPLVSGAAA